MKLWRDLEIGEKIELGDRCCGRNNEWITMDENILSLHESTEGLEVDFESFPFQREVSELNKG